MPAVNPASTTCPAALCDAETHGAPLDATVGDDEHDARVAVDLHGLSRHQHGCCATALVAADPLASFGIEERDAGAHLREDPRIAAVEADADLDGRLRAVGRRDDRDDARRNAPVGIGVQA